MNRWHFGASLLTLVLLANSPLWAERVPSSRVPSPPPATGSRPDIFVPYTTNGYSVLGGYKVAPRIYSSPTVDDPKNPGARPTFNLPFYGSVMSFGDRSNGAVSKPGAIPLPNR
jgi:hypothetical protein